MTADLVTVEVVRSSLAYAAEEMGLALRHAAYSPNIKERMDHSCALFDAAGRLLAQAEHIPVHLGSLPWGLRRTLAWMEEQGRSLREGDMVVVNDPYLAGTHLNDVTVIRPVVSDGRLRGYVANKAHHDDVGGLAPGSIAADARDLYQEGHIVRPALLVRDDAFVPETVEDILANSRTPAIREGDLKAQAAANFTGERRFLDLLRRYDPGTCEEAYEAIVAHARTLMGRAIRRLGDVATEAEDVLDDDGVGGGPVRLAVRVVAEGGRLRVDYAGTDPQVPGALNAVFGVTLSGVHFVVRCLLGQDVPLNEGCLEAVEVEAPEGTVLNPRPPAAVGGGNVETSQRNADLLFRAFAPILPHRVPAACGGSMNNVMFGGVRPDGTPWTFYETVAVGMGGRPGVDGVDGVHCNMTNTMNTPVEVIEGHYPLRVVQYAFRPDSGGVGQYRGGCGVLREFEVLEEGVAFGVLGERVKFPPWGLRGGRPGERTLYTLRRGDRTRTLPGKFRTVLEKGDRIALATAGGGGWGPPGERDRRAALADRESGLVSGAGEEDAP